jgi:hypothetical protein
MAGLFSKPKAPQTPPPPEPVPVPTVDEAAQSSEASDKVRRRKGMAATVLTQGAELAPAQTSAGAKLLGQ